jgi:hypothetical protein
MFGGSAVGLCGVIVVLGRLAVRVLGHILLHYDASRNASMRDGFRSDCRRVTIGVASDFRR